MSTAMQTDAPPPPQVLGILLKSDSVAAPYKSEVQASLQEYKLKNRNRSPKLIGILATKSGPSESYAEFTKKTCEDLGITFELRKTGAALQAEGKAEDGTVEDAIIEANEDESVDGIMVYYPIFGGLQDHYLQQVVSPFKDVEGLHVKFHYNSYHNIRFIRPNSLHLPTTSPSTLPSTFTTKDSETPPEGHLKSILPCTPLAIVKVLEFVGVYNKLLSYGDRAYGRTITVVNRSEVVGRPLAALLSNDGARVFSIDISSTQEYTKRPSSSARRQTHPHHIVQPSNLSLQECLAISDVVITAVPDPKYKVPTEWLKDGAVCLNVSSEKNFEKDVREKASLYIPAVGKVTILMLLRNLLRLCEYKELLEKSKEKEAAESKGSGFIYAQYTIDDVRGVSHPPVHLD